MPVPQAILTLAVPTVASLFSLASWVIRSRWQRRRWQCLCLCFGIRGVAWATPVAEIISLLVAAVMVVPYIRKLARGQEI